MVGYIQTTTFLNIVCFGIKKYYTGYAGTMCVGASTCAFFFAVSKRDLQGLQVDLAFRISAVEKW